MNEDNETLRLVMVEQIDGIISGLVSQMAWQTRVKDEKYEVFSGAYCWHVNQSEFWNFLKYGAKDGS